MSEKTIDLTVSIVLYKNRSELVIQAIKSLLNSGISLKLYLVDNSPNDHLRRLATDERIEYIFNDKNVGFGRGHNKVLREVGGLAKYHLVLNPDVYFESNVLPSILKLMNQDESIGLVMPMVKSFDSELQFLCKRLPRPLDLILRRFGARWLGGMIKERMDYYEMKDMDYRKPFNAPYLSGCFMFIRFDALRVAGFFDERFFMYLEDIDLSRRLSASHKTIYFPEVAVYHGHAKDSYNNLKLLAVHISSAIKYFNKWGWFFDAQRKRLNTEIEYYSNSDKW